jgi:hypothetical protein
LAYIQRSPDVQPLMTYDGAGISLASSSLSMRATRVVA